MLISHKKKFNCTVSRPEVFQCVLCRHKMFLHVDALKHLIGGHATKNTPKPYYTCSICAMDTYSKLILETHKCKGFLCDSVFKLESAPQNAEWFECELCCCTTKYKRPGLKMHLLSNHGSAQNVQWFNCEQCSQDDKPKTCLDNVKKIKCENCPFRTTQRHKLILHRMSKHPVITRVQRFQCGHCDFKTRIRNSLTLHLLEKHAGFSLSTHRLKSHDRKEQAVDGQWVKCDHCPLNGFKNRTRKYADRNENDQWFKCERCSFKSKSKSVLHSHNLEKHTRSYSRKSQTIL